MTIEVPQFKLPIVHYSASETNLPGFYSKTNLPEELANNQEVLNFLQIGVTQWSRIAAWTWCDYLAFHGTSLASKEHTIKNNLISLLTQQSSYADGYLNYGDDGSSSSANNKSQEIVNALLANNLNSWYKKDGTPVDWSNVAIDDIDLDKNIPELTLSDVLIKTTGQPLVTSIPPNEAFVKMFYVQITRDSFTGRIVRASNNPDNPYTKYINIIAYPPRPETFIDLPEVTAGDLDYDAYKDRDSLLRAWASGNKLKGGYLPPSAYIPIATT
jgi:hypothetical protein